MYQTYEDKLVISVNQWIEAGLSKNIFEHESKRGRLKIVQRALHGNTLIDVRSIKRLDIRKTIEATYGIIEKEVKTIPFIEEIHPDQFAYSFYSAYRYGDNLDKSLPSQDDNNVVSLYSNNAAILNAVKTLMDKKRSARGSSINKFRFGEWWKLCVNFVNVANASGWQNNLPKNPQAFKRVFKEYLNNGYGTLVSGKFGNNNTEKITEEARDWLIARWATPIEKLTLVQLFNEYNNKGKEEGWKPLQSEKTLRNFLNRKDIKPIWYGVRHGELLAKEKYVPQHRTLLPTMRDSIWYGDGTKLNLYYLNEENKISTCSVYEVIDAYSECFLGYAISKTENFEQQYRAYRMAFNFSGQKPYELRFDNQGGHKKLLSGEFLKRLAKMCIATKPYNGKSKTIESVFGRFQANFLHKETFFTGQNITATKQESRANLEFIMDNKQNLYSFEETVKRYEMRRNEWNRSEHHAAGRPRIEMYYSSTNEKATKVQLWERIGLFGILNAKPCTFRASGIELVVSGVKYAYDVLDADGFTDMDFRDKHTEGKFYIEYDLEDMSIVNLYEKTATGMRFVTMAQKYIHIHRGKQEQDELDAKIIAARQKAETTMRVETREKIEQMMEKEGLHPAQHGFNMPRLRGIGKKKQEEIINGIRPSKRIVSMNADPGKEMSNMAELELLDKF